MTKGDADEAEMMTAMITGFTLAGLRKIEDVVTPPVEWLEYSPNIRFRLASGMVVTVTIVVNPV